MSSQSALSARIVSSLEELNQVVGRVELLSNKAIKTGDDGYWDGVALNLYGFYSGVERIFEDIARPIDETLPEGADWHRDLLIQMAGEIKDRRPAVVKLETRQCIDEYRGFRHVVRNVYAFNFRPQRLTELVDNLLPCYQQVKADLLSFTQFLRSIG
jgi:hypothetical protein